MKALADFLRGFADGIDRAAGRDVVDQAAVEAAELLDDPAEVVVTGPDLTDNQALQVAIHFQETRRDLRRFQQMYGKASATIGHLRGRNAFLAEELLAARTTIRLARAELDLAAGESLSDAIVQTRDRARTLEAKLAEKNGTGRPTVAREDLANELLRAYTGNEESNAGVAIGWGPVADRAVTVLLGTSDAT
ncbi:MAG: hypothetical protein J0I34_07475 [Pseudonocardia sp.]|uniref:hypothetical protein n=1 Tax=Actinomycetes TaxID=1760 RepID=UPI00086AE00E|nr:MULTISPECIES: hypothetical protein [Actinomycetes]MBN9108608.1 hypothetical protein [Pseudonocardia sp.]ODU27487.1 MAG: hypothetical protein ABS80_03660 [Pseudonocardia sp. SCN 72-51]ODV07751.1 MAG: hypothetical protein ABT15_06660 [Pseudonocardia sp. SCN 73-27]